MSPNTPVFLRVNFNGEKIGDVFWHFHDYKSRVRFSDAARDIDGNMVFTFFFLDDEKYSSIFKVYSDNSIALIKKIIINEQLDQFIKLGIDQEGSYYFTVYENRPLPEFNSNSDSPFLVKVDKYGNEKWRHYIPMIYRQYFPVSIYTGFYYSRRITVAPSGDILYTGNVLLRDSIRISGPSMNGEPEEYKIFNMNTSFLARFTKDGELLWNYYLVPQKADGTPLHCSISDVQETADGSLITGGYIRRDHEEEHRVDDTWIMRLNSQGCLNDACDHISKHWHLPGSISSSEDVIMTVSNFLVYPTPGADFFHILPSPLWNYPLHISVYDMQGRKALDRKISQDEGIIRIDAHPLHTGSYLIHITDSNGNVSTGKWIKGG